MARVDHQRRAELIARLQLLGEADATQTALFQQAAAAHYGLGITEMRALSILLREGPRTAGQLAIGLHLTSGAVTGVVDRLSLGEFIRLELTGGFAAYMAYLLLAAQGGLDLRVGTPLFVSSQGHQPPVDPVSSMSFDVEREQLLRDTDVLKFVAGVLRGEQPW